MAFISILSRCLPLCVRVLPLSYELNHTNRRLKRVKLAFLFDFWQLQTNNQPRLRLDNNQLVSLK